MRRWRCRVLGLVLLSAGLLGIFGAILTRAGRLQPRAAHGQAATELDAMRSRTSATADSPAVDPDAAALIALSQQATLQAQTIAGDAVLRQIDIDWSSQETAFLFTDAAATQEIHVTVPDPTAPPDQWQVVGGLTSPLTTWTHPDIGIQALRVGPGVAAYALLQCAPQSSVRFLTLTDDPPAGNILAWYVSGDLSGMPIRVIVRNDTGAFRLDDPVLPVRTPVTLPPPE